MTLDTNFSDKDRVGVVGSNSSTGSLVVDLVGDSRSRSLNGKMVAVMPEDMDGTREVGLGMVTEITTTNPYHENTSLRGVIALQGSIANLTGRGDIKTAKVELQSAFRDDGGRVRPVGGSLTFAPSTGENVHLANNDLVQRLARQATNDLFYLGSIYRQRDILLPLSFHDFSGPRGASMAAFFGPSGGGKTHAATSFVACQTRHRDMAFLLIDPQGQFVTDSKMGRELPLDLRALAESQGREVQQLSVAHEVRLPQDATLFAELLDGASFFGASRMVGARSNAKEAREVVLSWLEETAGEWSEEDPQTLLDRMLQHLIERVEAGAVAVGDKVRERIAAHLLGALDATDDAGEATRKAMLRVWTPFLSLFTPTALDGTARKPMREIVKALCDQDTGFAGNRKGRPFYILTLADPSAGNGQESEVTRAMKQTRNQMVVLQTLFSALEEEGRRIYQSEGKEPTNLMVIMDEAARFTSDSSRDPQQREMASKIARFFRELRKFSIGFTLILQEPSALHDSIWKQLQNGFRAFAGGLVGNDLDKVREQIGSPGSLRLYQQLAQPTADNSVYPWVFCGSISPLNVTSEPSFMEAFTDPQVWAAANREWLPATYDVTDVWAG